LFGPGVQPGWVFAMISCRFVNPPGSPSESSGSAARMAFRMVMPPRKSWRIFHPYGFHVELSPPWQSSQPPAVSDVDAGYSPLHAVR